MHKETLLLLETHEAEAHLATCVSFAQILLYPYSFIPNGAS